MCARQREIPAKETPHDSQCRQIRGRTHRRVVAVKRNQFPLPEIIKESGKRRRERGANQARAAPLSKVFSAVFIRRVLHRSRRRSRSLRALLIDACSNSFSFISRLARRAAPTFSLQLLELPIIRRIARVENSHSKVGTGAIPSER